MKNRNVLALAYMGDAVYEEYIRKFLLNKGIEKVNDLQKEAIEYVSARSQAKFIKDLIDNNFFNETELEVIYRARNHKSRVNKNTTIATYKYSTALEAVIGYLYLNNDNERIEAIMAFILGE